VLALPTAEHIHISQSFFESEQRFNNPVHNTSKRIKQEEISFMEVLKGLVGLSDAECTSLSEEGFDCQLNLSIGELEDFAEILRGSTS
jgi:hypothetical protein